MSVVQPLPIAAPGEPVGDWRPARFTDTLSGTEDFVTDGDKLLAWADRYWSIPDAELFVLDDWQRWLIRRVLEKYPDDWPVPHLRGTLRYKRVVISMGRQNGKSVLGALFAIYFLCLHARGPRVIGLASIDRQAKIIYDRVRYAIDSNRALTHALKATGTRGITRRDGSGVYMTLPAVEDSAQGEPASGVLYDELHLGNAALWDAMVLAMRARPHSLMIGFTTAGDIASRLLLRLYDEGEAAIRGEKERFGFFCWEAPDDDLTPANIIAANPAVACGRVPLDQVYADALDMDADLELEEGMTGRQRRIRYTNNRFIEGAADAWANTHTWRTLTDPTRSWEHGAIIYGLERTEAWEAATITATSRLEGDQFATEIVATLTDPTPELLVQLCAALRRRDPDAAFAMHADSLGDLAKRLRRDGYTNVWALTEREAAAATDLGIATIARRGLTHPGDPLLTLQMPRTRSRPTDAGRRISRALTVGDCDAVMATTAGLYVAALSQQRTMQLF